MKWMKRFIIFCLLWMVMGYYYNRIIGDTEAREKSHSYMVRCEDATMIFTPPANIDTTCYYVLELDKKRTSESARLHKRQKIQDRVIFWKIVELPKEQ